MLAKSMKCMVSHKSSHIFFGLQRRCAIGIFFSFRIAPDLFFRRISTKYQPSTQRIWNNASKPEIHNEYACLYTVSHRNLQEMENHRNLQKSTNIIISVENVQKWTIRRFHWCLPSPIKNYSKTICIQYLGHTNHPWMTIFDFGQIPGRHLYLNVQK